MSWYLFILEIKQFNCLETPNCLKMQIYKIKNKALQNRLQILKSISNALQEVKDIKSGKRKVGRTLEEFLHEN
jgi:hypothetical protein